MNADVLLESITITSLAATLAIFTLHLVGRKRSPRKESVDFGMAFSVFIAGWMVTELLEALAPAGWGDATGILHFSVLAAFAVWMNARWRWALRRAREAA